MHRRARRCHRGNDRSATYHRRRSRRAAADGRRKSADASRRRNQHPTVMRCPSQRPAAGNGLLDRGPPSRRRGSRRQHNGIRRMVTGRRARRNDRSSAYAGRLSRKDRAPSNCRRMSPAREDWPASDCRRLPGPCTRRRHNRTSAYAGRLTRKHGPSAYGWRPHSRRWRHRTSAYGGRLSRKNRASAYRGRP